MRGHFAFGVEITERRRELDLQFKRIACKRRDVSKEKKAADVMTRGVQCAGADWTVEELGRFLADHSISGAPVIDEHGHVLGVVSATDIIRAAANGSILSSNGEQQQGAPAFYNDMASMNLDKSDLASMHLVSESMVTVRDIMTPMMFEVREDAELQEVADMMVRGRIHRVVVTHSGRVTGMISSLDLVRVLRDMLQ